MAAGLNIDYVGLVDYTLFEGLKFTLADSLLSRARVCEGHGIELWRRLHCEWEGSAHQLKHAKARKYQDPDRCSTTAALREALPEWERLGEDIKSAGFDAPDWVRISALEKILPADLLNTLVSRPELDTYAKKRHWVKCQMEHARGSLQAQVMSGPAVGKGKRDAGGDIVMGEVVKAILAQTDRGAEDSESVDSSPAGLWALHEQYAQVAGALQALAKGKGKGRGKGPPAASSTGGTKGSGKAGGKSNGKGDDFFDGNCHHCGKYGHRKIACRLLDREMAAKRADGKGKGRGLNEIIDDEEEPWQAGAEVNNETEAEWSFGIGCVSKGWPDAAAAPDLRPSRTMAPAGPSRLPPPHGPLWTTAGRARRSQPRAVTFADYAAAAAGPRVGSQKRGP